jgi:hypothetical protein
MYLIPQMDSCVALDFILFLAIGTILITYFDQIQSKIDHYIESPHPGPTHSSILDNSEWKGM